jgi:hypothetical protein
MGSAFGLALGLALESAVGLLMEPALGFELGFGPEGVPGAGQGLGGRC